jgi:putative CocE/NonD family hydrolase
MSNNWRALISKPHYGIRVEKDVMVTMRDGTRLAVDVFRPDAPGQFPALMAIAGYGKDAVEMSFPAQPLFKSAVWDGNLECGDVKEFAPRGYVHIVCDVRGIGHSEGEYVGGTPGQEARDGYDLVEWAAQQPWCSGKVGMLGYSYYGMMQLKTAIQQPPHLKAVFVSHVTFDHYRGYAYNGGVLSLMGYGIWDGRHGTSGIAPAKAVSEMVKTLPKEELDRRVNELLEDPDIKYYPNIYHLLHYP